MTTKRLWLALLLSVVAAVPASSQEDANAPFLHGHARFSVTAGYGSYASKDYMVAGLGGGYYFLDGLETGIDGQAWIGQKPHLYEITPEVRYTFLQMAQYKPYVGGFYRRTLYDDRAGMDSIGGRAGVAIPLSANTYLSAGAVGEHLFHCDRTFYDSCSQIYPEAAISFSF